MSPARAVEQRVQNAIVADMLGLHGAATSARQAIAGAVEDELRRARDHGLPAGIVIQGSMDGVIGASQLANVPATQAASALMQPVLRNSRYFERAWPEIARQLSQQLCTWADELGEEPAVMAQAAMDAAERASREDPKIGAAAVETFHRTLDEAVDSRCEQATSTQDTASAGG